VSDDEEETMKLSRALAFAFVLGTGTAFGPCAPPPDDEVDKSASFDAGAPDLRADLAPAPLPAPDAADDATARPDPTPTIADAAAARADAAWSDPPPPSDQACCQAANLVGIDDPQHQASPPYVAWNGRGWAAAWEDQETGRPTLRLIGADALPTGALVPVPGQQAMPSALAFHGGRYALLAGHAPFTPETQGSITLLDGAGAVLVQKPLPMADYGGAITRFPAANAWALATYHDLDGGVGGASRLVLYDDQLARTGPEIDLGRTLYADWRSIQIVALGDSLVVAQPTEQGIRVRAFTGASLLPGRSVMIGPEPAPAEPVTAIGAAGLRGRFVLGAMDGQTVRVWVYDPAKGALVSGPVVIAQSTGERTPGMAADEAGGTVGICFPDGEVPSMRDADTFRFAIVGPDGALRGQPITLAAGLRYAAGCSVAAGGRDEYVVTLWNAARDEPRHSILATRIRVRRAGE
jgi:hypothetical protein